MPASQDSLISDLAGTNVWFDHVHVISKGREGSPTGTSRRSARRSLVKTRARSAAQIFVDLGGRTALAPTRF